MQAKHARRDPLDRRIAIAATAAGVLLLSLAGGYLATRLSDNYFSGGAQQQTAPYRKGSKTARLQATEIPVSQVNFVPGMKIAKAYSVKAGNRAYTAAAVYRCDDQETGEAFKEPGCRFGGKIGIYASDGSEISKLEEEFKGMFYWDKMEFNMVGNEIHAAARLFGVGASNEWEAVNIYALEKPIRKVYSSYGPSIVFGEINGEPQIIEIAYKPLPGQENVSMANMRYYPEMSVFRWNGVAYERDLQKSARINEGRNGVITAVRQARNEEAASRAMQYLNSYDEGLQRLIMFVLVQEVRTEQLLKELEATAKIEFAGAGLQALADAMLSGSVPVAPLFSVIARQHAVAQTFGPSAIGTGEPGSWTDAAQAARSPPEKVMIGNTSIDKDIAEKYAGPNWTVREDLIDRMREEQSARNQRLREAEQIRRDREYLQRLPGRVDEALGQLSKPPAGGRSSSEEEKAKQIREERQRVWKEEQKPKFPDPVKSARELGEAMGKAFGNIGKSPRR